MFIQICHCLLAAWITTGGTFAGIMKEIGSYVSKTSRVSKNPPLLLGIQFLLNILVIYTLP